MRKRALLDLLETAEADVDSAMSPQTARDGGSCATTVPEPGSSAEPAATEEDVTPPSGGPETNSKAEGEEAVAETALASAPAPGTPVEDIQKDLPTAAGGRELSGHGTRSWFGFRTYGADFSSREHSL